MHIPQCDDQTDRETWQRLVQTVFPEAKTNAVQESLFLLLWNHFEIASTWRLDPALGDLFAWAHDHQCEICIASNFDGRLNKIVAGFNELQNIKKCFVSTEVGVPKPSPGFYQSILDDLQLNPEEIVMAGDSWCEDVAVPTSMGITSFWINSERKVDHPRMASNLRELLQHLR